MENVNLHVVGKKTVRFPQEVFDFDLPFAGATLEPRLAQAESETSDAGAHVGALRHRV